MRLLVALLFCLALLEAVPLQCKRGRINTNLKIQDDLELLLIKSIPKMLSLSECLHVAILKKFGYLDSQSIKEMHAGFEALSTTCFATAFPVGFLKSTQNSIQSILEAIKSTDRLKCRREVYTTGRIRTILNSTSISETITVDQLTSVRSPVAELQAVIKKVQNKAFEKLGSDSKAILRKNRNEVTKSAADLVLFWMRFVLDRTERELIEDLQSCLDNLVCIGANMPTIIGKCLDLQKSLDIVIELVDAAATKFFDCIDAKIPNLEHLITLSEIGQV